MDNVNRSIKAAKTVLMLSELADDLEENGKTMVQEDFEDIADFLREAVALLGIEVAKAGIVACKDFLEFERRPAPTGTTN